MTEVENLIYQYDGQQREIMAYFHNLLTIDYNLTSKITFKNPCYYGRSWICYIKPLKTGSIELAFMRGNELSNDRELLKGNGRKQLRSIEFSSVSEIPFNDIKQIINESIVLDSSIPYRSKRSHRK